MQPALIATDLDGTFLGAGSLPHLGNLAAARRAVERGVRFVVATGRPRRLLQGVRDLADLNPWVISSNGAALGPLNAARPSLIHPIDPEAVLRFASALPSELAVSYAVEYEVDWGREDSFPNGPFGPAGTVMPLQDLVALEPVVKVIAWTDRADTHTFAPIAESAASGLLQATFSWHSQHGAVELSAPGVTKGSALAELLTRLAIDPDGCVAFGDMPNDLQMLELVGRGYIMAACDPILLDRGFSQLGKHEDGAVGVEIDRLIGAA